ncbi:hypothetical protein Afil01_46510 [Actinorhabdospora filicis]|uniref:Uncharacterized protein n=2 Tax=Actinorhabdospora filicis TaxID=1785913 RepID=A0A9W6SMW5_9ACTN|nr:hypothetical protein Afil01_46510 [Actinorhabdospora filicis]
MAGAVGVALTRMGAGKIAMVFLVAALVLAVLTFAGPALMLGRGSPGGVIAVAVAHAVGCLGAIPGIVPEDVVSPWVFQAWLVFAPMTLWILVALWLPGSREWLAWKRRARESAPAVAEQEAEPEASAPR